MRKTIKTGLLLAALILSNACANCVSAPKQLAIQPFTGLPLAKALYVYNHMKAIYANCVLLAPCPLPRQAWYAPRQRYKADSLINWLSGKAKPNQVVAGITTSDISTTKGDVADYGVMGLGENPGNACVISTFRLKDASNEQLFKVVIHEFGHTQGLPHCPVKTCYMRDAEGHNPTDEETEFCASCKKVLISKGWKL